MIKKLKIFIDIDGVLLSKKYQAPVKNALALLKLITTRFDPYWLTTHCNGSTEPALYYLANFYDKEFIAVASKIKPTNWDSMKTEALPNSSKFFWIDDEPFNSEKIFLEKKGRLDCLIIPDFSKEADLMPVVEFLSKFIAE